MATRFFKSLITGALIFLAFNQGQCQSTLNNRHLYFGLGSNPSEVIAFFDSLQITPDTILYLYYVNPKYGIKKRMDKLLSIIDSFKTLGTTILPVIGLKVTERAPPISYLPELIDGKYDDELSTLYDYLQKIPGPVYVRTGFEFILPQKKIDPDDYITFFRRVSKDFKTKTPHVIHIWCANSRPLEQLMKYYPGDDVVDWWAIDLFTSDHIKSKHTTDFLNAAQNAGKKVMIAESSIWGFKPETDEQIILDEWVTPFFNLLENHSHIKGIVFINRIWEKGWNSKVKATGLIHEEMSMKVNQILSTGEK